jgi:hypothetical protein
VAAATGAGGGTDATSGGSESCCAGVESAGTFSALEDDFSALEDDTDGARLAPDGSASGGKGRGGVRMRETARRGGGVIVVCRSLVAGVRLGRGNAGDDARWLERSAVVESEGAGGGLTEGKGPAFAIFRSTSFRRR